MKVLAIAAVFAATALLSPGGPATPFDLPRGAVVDRQSAGWDFSGRVPLSMSHARMQFASRLAAAGWINIHSIDVSKDRTVEAWSRGRRTLTLMLWRIDSGSCGFSCGLGGDGLEGGGK